MKKKYSIILLVFIAIISSCSKDPIISTPDQAGRSKITHFPSITVNGDRIVALPLNGTFTDAGAKALAGTAEIPVVVSGAVNTSVAGTYTLSYVATNADGFNTTGYRTVVVYATAPDAAAQDLSGTYLRAATGEFATWSKIAPGVYTILNPGGSTIGEDLIVAAINPSGFEISIPSQRASDGSVSSSTSEVYTNSSPPSYQLIFLNSLYGTGVRTFVKQ